MRRWATAAPDKVWAYRTLLPRAAAGGWHLRSTGQIGWRRHFYTSAAEDEESDRIERWLSTEVENPAIPVIQKLLRGEALASDDRPKLARYIASLEARTPLAFVRYRDIMSEKLPPVLERIVERAAEQLEIAAKTGQPIPPPPELPPHQKHSVAVALREDEHDPNRGQIDLNVVIGREMWLESIENVVDNVAMIMVNHDWKVLRPNPGWTFITSDQPLLRLGKRPNGSYNYEGRWGDADTVLMLPLSPEHLLYAVVGSPAPEVNELDIDGMVSLHRNVCATAYRWIIAKYPIRHVEWFQPQVVDLDAFIREEKEWEEFHQTQTEAQRGLRKQPAPERQAPPDADEKA
jgi:hypothetical protein